MTGILAKAANFDFMCFKVLLLLDDWLHKKTEWKPYGRNAILEDQVSGSDVIVTLV